MALECAAADDFKLIIGSEFLVHDSTPFRLVVLARNREGYGHLCEFITRLRRAVDGKGQAPLTRQGSSPKPCLIACFCFCPIVRPFGPAPRSGALSAQT